MRVSTLPVPAKARDPDHRAGSVRHTLVDRPARDPVASTDAIVQVYGARCARALGWFGIHTWIAVKPTGATRFTVYQVIAGRLRMRGTVLAIRSHVPDAPWFGNPPRLLAERCGDGVDALIERIDRVARAYPYARRYLAWPGPNSNTFTAHVARCVPELGLDLPPTAIGKDYLGARCIGPAPSGRGMQVVWLGLLGALVSRVEGIEFNVLGLNFGIDPFAPALRLPLIGRVGAKRARPLLQPPYSHGESATVSGLNSPPHSASTTRRMTTA